MGRTEQIRVDKDLVVALEQIRREVAEKIKQEFGVANLDIPGTIISRILAYRLINDKKKFDFKVKKSNGSNHGIIFFN